MNFAYFGYFGDIPSFSQCVRAKSELGATSSRPAFSESHHL